MKELSSKLGSMKPSATLRISAKAKEYASHGAIDFGVGEPNFDLNRGIKDAGISAINSDKNRYTPVPGIMELRRAVCDKLKLDNGLSYAPENILVSSGAKHSLFNIFLALLNPGDEVIVFKPFWVSYEDQIRLAGGVPVFVATDENFHIVPGLFEKAITKRTKAVVINTPSNPTGAVEPRETLEKVAKISVINDLYVISDEVYEYFIFDSREHVSIASLGKDIFERTITVNACSKSHSMTGLRIGYAAGSAKIIGLMNTLQGQVTSGASSVAQYMAVAALSQEQKDMAGIVSGFQAKRDLASKLLAEAGLPCKRPEGAFYFFIPIKHLSISSDAFCERLIEEEKVALVPGSAFGAEGFVRLSYAISEDKLREGIARLGRFVAKLKAEGKDDGGYAE